MRRSLHQLFFYVDLVQGHTANPYTALKAMKYTIQKMLNFFESLCTRRRKAVHRLGFCTVGLNVAILKIIQQVLLKIGIIIGKTDLDTFLFI